MRYKHKWSISESGLAVFWPRPGLSLGFRNFTTSYYTVQNASALSLDQRAIGEEGEKKEV